LWSLLQGKHKVSGVTSAACTSWRICTPLVCLCFSKRMDAGADRETLAFRLIVD